MSGHIMLNLSYALSAGDKLGPYEIFAHRAGAWERCGKRATCGWGAPSRL